MKLYALTFISLIFLLNGCAGPDLPNLNDKKGLNEVSIEKIANEFKLRKLSDTQYKGLFSKSAGKSYRIDTFLSAYCEAKNNIYIANLDISNGNLIKACKSPSSETPLFLLDIKYTEHTKNDDSAFITLDFSDSAKNNWINQKLKQEEELKNTIKRQEAERKTREEEYQKQIIEEEKRILNLKNRKGQQTMTFYTSWKYIGNSNRCEASCSEENRINTGYLTLQNALNDGWHFKSSLNQISKSIDNQCTCEGSITILEK